ncbi:MAG: hypothetical protein R2726_08985 [Acidimicrobiales bacterium]
MARLEGTSPLSADHERMLDPSYLADLADRPIEQVRVMRAECVAAETGLSYLRRMVQGPLDIVGHELARRAEGAGSSDLAAIVADLPDALGEHGRPPGVGRLPRTLEPTDVDPELEAALDALVGDGRLARVPDMADDELADLAGRLRDYEELVSDRRRAFFGAIDALQAEIARRYRDGEASVESLLEG